MRSRSRAPLHGPAPRDPEVTAVIVHYRTPDFLAASVEALQADARNSGLSVQVIVVDNGASSAPPHERLDPGHLRTWVIEPSSNLGYAGGVNLGARAPSGDVLLLMNADVIVAPGCLRALVEALREADIAGPRLFWDRGGRLMLPPQQVRTRAAELDAVWAERSTLWGRSYRRRWRRRARAFWSARQPMPCFELTGALLAMRTECWRRVGPFDEGFRLYFEETDWLLRARAKGARAVLVPAASAVHAYDQSAQLEPRAQRWFDESMRRFRRRRYGAWFAALLRLIERLPRRFADLPALPAGAVHGEAWIEVTTLPLGVPSAGCRLGGAPPADFELPPEIVREARSDLCVRASDAGCRDLRDK